MGSSHFVPPPLGISEEEAGRRFDALQRGLGEQWKLIRSMNQLEQTMVVVPSVSVDLDVPATVLQAYEERLLFLLLLLRKPRAHIIYCTSQPIQPNVVDYYLGLLPGVIPSHARQRLVTVPVHDASPRPLTLKILERPRLIERIRQLIADPGTTHIVPFNTTRLERDLALRLGIPMYAADPRLLSLGTKSGARRIFEEEGVPHALGVQGARTEAEVVDAIVQLRSRRAGLEQVLVKLDEGVSGMGNATVNLGGLPRPGDPGETQAVRERTRGMRLELAGATVEGFMDKLAGEGGVVEERIVGDVVRSPSVQLRITPLGDVEILSTHDQVLGGSTGQSYLGCRFPADPGYAVAITHEAAKVGQRLCREGVLGRLAVDFVVVQRRDGTWDPYAIEINLRKGGTTIPYLTLEFLTNGRYDPHTGLFTAPSGRHKSYVANDHVESPPFRSINVDDLFDFVVRHGLHFDHTTQSGVVLHMLSALTEEGRFGLTAVADSPEDATELYDRTVATLGFEADRAGSGVAGET